MRYIALQVCVLGYALAASGCSIMAPSYNAALDNVQQLKAAGDFTAKVGPFTADPAHANDGGISLRGTPMKSPSSDSYASYLADALKQELSLARKLAPDAEIEISGVLLKNDISVGSFETGYGDIEARFTVKRGGAVRYDATKSQHNQWESSFPGMVAIPRGQQGLPQPGARPVKQTLRRSRLRRRTQIRRRHAGKSLPAPATVPLQLHRHWHLSRVPGLSRAAPSESRWSVHSPVWPR